LDGELIGAHAFGATARMLLLLLLLRLLTSSDCTHAAAATCPDDKAACLLLLPTSITSTLPFKKKITSTLDCRHEA